MIILCPPVRSTFAVRETASLGIMEAPGLPPLNPSETIELSIFAGGIPWNTLHTIPWMSCALFLFFLFLFYLFLFLNISTQENTTIVSQIKQQVFYIKFV